MFYPMRIQILLKFYCVLYLFRVIEAVILGTAIVGQAVAFAPDYQKAKVAAVRIFKLLDLKPKIDAFSKVGRMLVSKKKISLYFQIYKILLKLL